MFQHILVPVTDDPCSQLASEHARNLSRLLGCRLSFVHVLEGEAPNPAATRASAQALLERMAAGSRFPASLRVVPEGGKSIPERILEVARDEGADLIVIGTHARQGVERLMLGSVALAVVSASRIPVQMIPPHQAAGRRFVDQWRRALTPRED